MRPEPQGGSAADFLRNTAGPLVAAIREAITAQGRSIDEVAELCGRVFLYEGKPEKDWKTCERTPISFWEATFADKTRIEVWWQHEHQEQLTYEQAKAALDRKRLTFDGHQFFDAYVPQAAPAVRR